MRKKWSRKKIKCWSNLGIPIYFLKNSLPFAKDDSSSLLVLNFVTVSRLRDNFARDNRLSLCNTTVLKHWKRLKHIPLTITLWTFLHFFFNSACFCAMIDYSFSSWLINLIGSFKIKIYNHLTFQRQRKFCHSHSLTHSLILSSNYPFPCACSEEHYLACC